MTEQNRREAPPRWGDDLEHEWSKNPRIVPGGTVGGQEEQQEEQQEPIFLDNLDHILAHTFSQIQRRYMNRELEAGRTDLWADWERRNKIWFQRAGEWTADAEFDERIDVYRFKMISGYGGAQTERPHGHRPFSVAHGWDFRLADPEQGNDSPIDFSGFIEIGRYAENGGYERYMRETWISTTDLINRDLFRDPGTGEVHPHYAALWVYWDRIRALHWLHTQQRDVWVKEHGLTHPGAYQRATPGF